MIVHAHDIVNFLHCRRKDHYQRVRGLEVTHLGRAGTIGSMFHAIMAGKLDAYIQEQAQQGREIPHDDITLAQDMAAFYQQQYTTILPPVREKLSEEQELYIEVEGHTILCRPDLVYRDTNNQIHLIDYKTKEVLPSDYTWFDMDPQMMIYQIACSRYGWWPVIVEHVLVRRSVPPGFGSRSEVTSGIDKNGKAFSRKSTASKDPNDYIRTFHFSVSATAVQAYERELGRILTEMATAQAIRSPGPLCTSCTYLPICSRELKGESVSDAEVRSYMTLFSTIL